MIGTFILGFLAFPIALIGFKLALDAFLANDGEGYIEDVDAGDIYINSEPFQLDLFGYAEKDSSYPASVYKFRSGRWRQEYERNA